MIVEHTLQAPVLSHEELLAKLADDAYRIRRYALRMGEVQGQGYIAQALGIADMLPVAYGHALAYRADQPKWEGRDRFLLSPGHYAIALYAALIHAGVLPEADLETYRPEYSRLPMCGPAPCIPALATAGWTSGPGSAIVAGRTRMARGEGGR